MKNLPYVAEKKIEAIRDEFHEWNDKQIQPGFNISDLMTREECARATALLNTEIRAINDQIAQARLDHAKGRKQLDGNWLYRAGKAIRYKRDVIGAIRAKSDGMPKSARREDFRKVLLQVIAEDIGEAKMQAYADAAHKRFAPGDISVDSGENANG